VGAQDRSLTLLLQVLANMKALSLTPQNWTLESGARRSSHGESFLPTSPSRGWKRVGLAVNVIYLSPFLPTSPSRGWKHFGAESLTAVAVLFYLLPLRGDGNNSVLLGSLTLTLLFYLLPLRGDGNEICLNGFSLFVCILFSLLPLRGDGNESTRM